MSLHLFAGLQWSPVVFTGVVESLLVSLVSPGSNAALLTIFIFESTIIRIRELPKFESVMPGNLFHHQDAFEFFSNLTDQVDEVLKKNKLPQVFQKTLGGVFLDQKLCRGCEHKLATSSHSNV